MPSGGSSTTQNSEPWEGQQPFLTDTFGQAQNLYYDWRPDYFPGQTYPGLSPATLSGLDQTMDRSGGSLLEQQSLGTIGDVAGGGGVGSNPLYNLLGSAAAGQDVYNDPRFSYLSNMAAGGNIGQSPIYSLLGGLAGGGGLGANPAFDYLGGIAQGENVGQNPAYNLLGDIATQEGTNPFLNDMFEQGATRIGDIYRTSTAPSTLAAFSGAGRRLERGGSDALKETQSLQSRDLGDRLNDFATNLYGSQYQADQNRRLAASQGLGGLYTSDIAQQLGAGGQLGGLYGQEVGQQLGAAGQVGGAYGQEIGQQLGAAGQVGGAYQFGEANRLGAAGQLGSLWDTEANRQLQAALAGPGISQATDYGNIQQLLGAGQAIEQQSGLGIQEDINRWNYYAQQPYDLLNQYMNIVGNGNFGSNTTSNTSESLGAGEIMGTMASLAGIAAMAMT